MVSFNFDLSEIVFLHYIRNEVRHKIWGLSEPHLGYMYIEKHGNDNILGQKRKYWENLHFQFYCFLASIQVPGIIPKCACYSWISPVLGFFKICGESRCFGKKPLYGVVRGNCRSRAIYHHPKILYNDP
jgi:hypothetical protein